MKPAAPSPRVIVPSTTKRDMLITLVVGALLLAFVIYGVMSMGKPAENKNVLTGPIVAKEFIPQKEEQVSFSGRRLKGVKQIDGEYILRVRIEKENRTYDIAVEKFKYDTKQVGDKLEFMRPPSEQK